MGSAAAGRGRPGSVARNATAQGGRGRCGSPRGRGGRGRVRGRSDRRRLGEGQADKMPVVDADAGAAQQRSATAAAFRSNLATIRPSATLAPAHPQPRFARTQNPPSQQDPCNHAQLPRLQLHRFATHPRTTPCRQSCQRISFINIEVISSPPPCRISRRRIPALHRADDRPWPKNKHSLNQIHTELGADREQKVRCRGLPKAGAGSSFTGRAHIRRTRPADPLAIVPHQETLTPVGLGSQALNPTAGLPADT